MTLLTYRPWNSLGIRLESMTPVDPEDDELKQQYLLISLLPQLHIRYRLSKSLSTVEHSVGSSNTGTGLTS